MFDLVLSGGEVILPNKGQTPCDIGIANGKIESLVPHGSKIKGKEVIDVKDHIIFPGIIDVHLHLGHGSDISRPKVPSDAEIETSGAAKGGITCMVPYLMATDPFENIFDNVLNITKAGSKIDFGYHFIISTEEQLENVPLYVNMGIPSFKIFMNNRGGEGTRLGLPDLDDGFLFRLLESAANSGGMVCPHPENIEVAWVLRERAMNSDPTGKEGLYSWDATRPDFVEADAVQRAGMFATVTGAPLYIVHTSSGLALETGLSLRKSGSRIFLETCPHYLTHDVNWTGKDVGKINPPLRHKMDCERLWQAVENGDIDTIATDHVHRDISSKQGGIWKASPGCPGMETLLPIMLTEGFHRRNIPLLRIAELLSSNPAKLMGLGHRKGSISVGMDADFAIVNLNNEWLVQRHEIISSAGYSIYEDWAMKGKVRDTIVRGKAIWRNYQPVSNVKGWGEFVPRKLENEERLRA